MIFQNTIAYGQFYNAGGSISPVADDWIELGYTATEVDGLVKNLHPDPTSSQYGFKVTQTGSYFYDISFCAGGGDGKSYTVRTLVNGVANAEIEQLQFYQQNIDQKYEVSGNNIVNLAEGDIVRWQLYVPSVSATAMTLKHIKLCVYNLQQLGSH